MSKNRRQARPNQQHPTRFEKTEFYQGIIPHPEAMQSYENINRVLLIEYYLLPKAK
jgi:hypothetical protein